VGPVCRASARAGGSRLITSPGASFVVIEREGSPEELLSAAYRMWDSRTAVVCRPTSPALVLGSAQRESSFDLARCGAAGLDVVRRRSGGGAVVVRPGAQIWLDFFVPRHDPLFDEDVLASFGFVGEIWKAALLDSLPAVAPSSLAVARGPAVATSWSATLCFGGLGAGEVTIDGRKVVGVSQRRDRDGAWFHSMALVEFDPAELTSLLACPQARRIEAAAWLAGSAAGVPGGLEAAPALTSSIVARLG
jgi:lipoate---protein ligase